jgi:MFS family permease
MATIGEASPTRVGSAAPARAGAILGTLILVAAVANLNLAVANVALPDIGDAFDASQTGLDMVAIGYSLGLAGSVLWLGALGDRYGRKRMVLFGMALSIPACLVAAWAPTLGVLVAARIVGGLSADCRRPLAPSSVLSEPEEEPCRRCRFARPGRSA